MPQTQTTPVQTPPPSARPFALSPLFRHLGTINGVGPKLAPLLAKLVGGDKIRDVLWHKPIDVIDRTYRPDLHHAEDGKIATLVVDILEHRPPKRGGTPYRIVAGDGHGYVDLVFFNPRGDYLEKTFPPFQKMTISGKLERYGGKWQITHPDKLNDTDNAPAFEPVYPLSAGITNRVITKCVRAALPMLPELPEWIDAALMGREHWPRHADAVRALHTLDSPDGLSPRALNRRRLAYDELLADQLAITIVRERERGLAGRTYQTNGPLRQSALAALPFTLTAAQTRAVSEIDADMAKPLRMMRLLQGDVGSGKTVVALMAALNAVDSGAQAAIMAPTEILATQHAQTLMPLLDQIGVNAVLLTGRHKGRERDDILANIANGSARMIIGTHALFQDDVTFHDLGVAVIDEQHRFGVHQRLTLSSKGRGIDLLVMTATPIPRTLALTAYGDLDVSKLDEKPPGRKPIDTRLIPLPRMMDLIDGLEKQMADGVQAYWVCPLVEESEVLDLAAAEDRYAMLSERFGVRVGLVHGRMKPADKDAVMKKFSDGGIKILVATTVIEVGVNVPAATVMIIEHAERFGLAQLHQLRGRVGRGSAQSYCFLLFHEKCGQTARERLKTMRETEDGFLIAERDLTLRGPGDILGTAQSGVPILRFADLSNSGDLLDIARDDARLVYQKDPGLKSERGQALRHLLYLFERDQAIKRLQAG
jgi:ATP-dependent DNA helicase RecG